MSRRTWTFLKTEARARLVASCAWLDQRPSQLDAFAMLVALAEVKLSAVVDQGRLEAQLRTAPSIGKDQLAGELVGMIAELASDYASRPRPASSPAFGDWVEAHGFSDMAVALLSTDARWEDWTAAAETIARAIKTLSSRSHELALTHMGNVLTRDLPDALGLRNGLTSVAAWLLVPETSGLPNRADILLRRRQAMSLYGALSGSLLDADITSAIDAGLPLAPLLQRRHALTAAELRALRQASSLRHAIETPTDFHVAVEELKAHQVPLHEWPGDGRPGEVLAWERSVWVRGQRQHMVRPDYLGLNTTSVSDALNALRDDLLRPLVADRVRQGGLTPDGKVYRFASSMEVDATHGGGEMRRDFLAALRTAIVGNRGPKAFQEAVGLWHRRVASLSALRHERRAEQPGWPALCQPWQSSCGHFDIVVLASAAELVEEGRLLDHCVGGYYDICRRGDTQILSLREDGRHAATVELKLGSDLSSITIEVGQFKAYRNSAPPVHLHEPLRSFLRDVRTGAHPVNAQHLAAYRKTMRDRWDGSWSSQTLSLDHAREVFAFYLPLLPRGTPASFDAWCQQSGLSSAIDATLAKLEAGSRQPSFISVPLRTTKEHSNASL